MGNAWRHYWRGFGRCGLFEDPAPSAHGPGYGARTFHYTVARWKFCTRHKVMFCSLIRDLRLSRNTKCCTCAHPHSWLRLQVESEWWDCNGYLFGGLHGWNTFSYSPRKTEKPCEIRATAIWKTFREPLQCAT